jgi:hypothetical protein
MTIENKCDGDVSLFNRYYPSTWEMAFQSREVCLFEPHTIERFKAQRLDPSVGSMHLVNGAPKFHERDAAAQRRAKWDAMLWERPVDGEEYVLAADVSEGVEGGDYSAAYVGKVDRQLGQVVVVAGIHGTLDPDIFAEQLDLLGQWYGDALLAVEVNRTFEVMRILRKRGYPNLYWRRDPTNPRSKTKTPGWHTNPKTRPLMLAALRAMARDNDLACRDYGLPDEMAHMIPGKGGRWEARKGAHDDRVMALGILCAVVGFRDKRGRRRRADQLKRDLAKKVEDDAVSVMSKRRAWAKSMQLKNPGKRSVSL